MKSKKIYVTENGHKLQMSRNDPDLSKARCTKNVCEIYRIPYCMKEWDPNSECPLRQIEYNSNAKDEGLTTEPQPCQEDCEQDEKPDDSSNQDGTVDPNANNNVTTVDQGSAVTTIVLILAIGGGFAFFLIA